MTKKEYAALSKLAPVVAQPKGEVDYGSSWQEETLITGKAVGQPERRRSSSTQTEKLVADAAADAPGVQGQDGRERQPTTRASSSTARRTCARACSKSSASPTRRTLRDAFPKEFGGQLSDEKIDAARRRRARLVRRRRPQRGRAQEQTASTRKLDVRKEGRDVFIRGDDRVYDATSFPSVLSMPTLMKELVPRLAAAVDGDPTTSTDQQG